MKYKVKQTSSAEVSSEGTWELLFFNLEASEEETLCVKCKDEEVMITAVAIGEVWIAAGQSNMEFPLCYEKHYEEEKNHVNRNLRFYDVPEICYEGQDKDFDYSHVGVWRKAEGDDLKYFSAVGYYFQKELEDVLHVPVGIIGCNWGGSYLAAWMSRETIERVGQDWIEHYNQTIENLDLDEYWVNQKNNLMNDRGNPNMDPVSGLMLSRTITVEEFMKIISNGEINPTIMLEYVEPKTRPSCLYDLMIKMIAGYTIKGVLWYQGESDDVPGLQHLYCEMLEGMISDWRTVWNCEELPFIVVQLPGWSSWLGQKANDYVTIRDCQKNVTDHDSGVALVSISDIGEELDIHPAIPFRFTICK